MGCRANMERKSLETRQEALCQVSCVQSFSWRHFPTAVYINGASSFIVTDAAFSALIVCLDFASGLYVGLYSVFWFFSVLSPCPIVCVGFFFFVLSQTFPEIENLCCTALRHWVINYVHWEKHLHKICMRSPGLYCSVCIADLHVVHLLWQGSVEKINRQKLIMPDYYGLEDRPRTADVGFFSPFGCCCYCVEFTQSTDVANGWPVVELWTPIPSNAGSWTSELLTREYYTSKQPLIHV